MSEVSLASLPGKSLPGLDMGQVERERKDMWSRMFKKYEVMEERDEMSEEVNLEDMDKPETVQKIFQQRFRSQSVQPSSIVKQYLNEHADEMDEIATIAGPPASDEEVLSDDSEDELTYSSESDSYNVAGDGMNHMPLTPATSDIYDENSDGDTSDEASEVEEVDATLSGLDEYEDINSTLVGLDDDDLYSAAPLPITKDIFDKNHNTYSFQEPSNKKSRFKSPLRSCIDESSDEDGLMISQEKIDNTVDDYNSKAKKSRIVCCQCLSSTFYYALPVREQLVCDECLSGDHINCEVEECRVCKEVAELISLRRQAEVFGRLEYEKSQLSSTELYEKTVKCGEDDTDSHIIIEESMRKPCDTTNICDIDVEEPQIEPEVGTGQSNRSMPSPGEIAGGLPQHQFLPPLAQCAAGQYPNSLVSLLPDQKYSLNKVYPRPGCDFGITLYYCCIMKSMGCKGKCKVKLDKENKVELVHFSDIEHNH